MNIAIRNRADWLCLVERLMMVVMVVLSWLIRAARRGSETRPYSRLTSLTEGWAGVRWPYPMVVDRLRQGFTLSVVTGAKTLD